MALALEGVGARRVARHQPLCGGGDGGGLGATAGGGREEARTPRSSGD